jgi:acetyltransferase-like isoleucine patch superfamily enzyme
MYKKIFLINRYPFYLRKLWWNYLGGDYVTNALVRFSGVHVAARTRFYGMPIVYICKSSEILIGEDCVLCSISDVTDLGVNHPIMLRTLRPGATIAIGKNVGMSGGAICAAVRVEIGNDCLIGANVVISDTDFHPLSPVGRRYNMNQNEIAASPVIIEDNVFIGTGAIILKGVRVGKNSVIGAGAVVTKDIPANSIAAGNPARLIKSFDETH